MGAHARLSPSSAERWLNCPGSVRLVDQLEIDIYSESPYAREGTLAHRVCEILAMEEFDYLTAPEATEAMQHHRSVVEGEGFDFDTMVVHARDYVQLLRDLAAEHPRSTVLIEQRVESGIPGCWGTADAIIVSPTHLHVVDYKYGMGVLVSAENNPQAKLYGLGGLEGFGLLGNIETVCTTIFQPRTGDVSHACYSAKELVEWRDLEAAPIAALAASGDGFLSPSESACRFCPAAGECRVRSEFMLRRDFGNPDVLSPAELAEVLGQIDDIENWCKAVREVSLHKAFNESVPIPGWKVVRSAGRRKIVDDEAAIQALMAAKFRKKDVSRITTQTLTVLERLVGGKKRLHEILGELIQTGDGKESLVPEDDDRIAIDSLTEAAIDFADPII